MKKQNNFKTKDFIIKDSKNKILIEDDENYINFKLKLKKRLLDNLNVKHFLKDD